MMKYVLTLILAILSLNLLANENDKTFLDANFLPLEDMSGAQYYRMVTHTADSLFYMEVYYLTDNPQMKGHFKDQELTVLHGKCSYYHINGKLESEGNYNNGKRIGYWKRYSLFGESKSDRYYPTQEEVDSARNRKSAFPSFKGGEQALNRFCHNNTSIPKDSLLIGKKGTVTAYVSVNEIGKIMSYEILSSPGQAYTVESEKIIEKMPLWEPAYLNGKAIESNLIVKLPINFMQVMEAKKDKKAGKFSESLITRKKATVITK